MKFYLWRPLYFWILTAILWGYAIHTGAFQARWALVDGERVYFDLQIGGKYE